MRCLRPTFLALLATLVAVAPQARAQAVQMAPLAPGSAKLIEKVARVAQADLAAMPAIRLTSQLGAVCGGGEGNPHMRYCTSENAIYVSATLERDVGDEATASYMLAHMLGHAVQVRHGQADLALSMIRAEPAREAVLRGMVTRQVECIAGVIFGRALGTRPARLGDWFSEEPFTDAHWGRNPVSAGPRVSIGLEARAEWFERGLGAGRLSACAVEELGTDRIERAER